MDITRRRARRKERAKPVGRLEQVWKPQGSFVPHEKRLIESPAWRAQSINCRRLIEFLEIEHLNHGGRENGHLLAPHSQLHEFGISRRLIAATVEEAEGLGLIAVRRGGRAGGARVNPTRFRLTYLPSKEVNEWGQPYYVAPTDEWARVTADKAEAVKLTVRSKTRKLPPQSEPNYPHKVNNSAPISGGNENAKSLKRNDRPLPPEVGALSISRRDHGNGRTPPPAAPRSTSYEKQRPPSHVGPRPSGEALDTTEDIAMHNGNTIVLDDFRGATRKRRWSTPTVAEAPHDDRTFGLWQRAERERLGVTVGELAAATGFEHEFIEAIEVGKAVLVPPMCRRIAAALAEADGRS